MTNETRRIVVGDVGGTNVRLAIAHLSADRIELGPVWKKPGAGFATFDAALTAFTSQPEVASNGAIEGAALGLAGPVLGDRVEMLHRDWVVDTAGIANLLSTDAIVLVNDFVAMARSAPELDSEDLESIAPGVAVPGCNVVVGGPGTGLGLGTLKSTPSENGAPGWVVVGGEGGHQLFTPLNELEWQVASHLRAAGTYVSNEVIASGSGFEETLSALALAMGETIRTRDPEAVIGLAKQGGKLELELCRLRARTTMSALGDAALAANARGGVYIAGGVSAHLKPWLMEPEAIDCFRQRGPRSGVLADIPLQLITGDTAALIGAAALWRDRQTRGWI